MLGRRPVHHGVRAGTGERSGLGTHVLLDALVAERGLVAREGEAGDGGAVVVLGDERAERAPAAANVKDTVLRLEIKLWEGEA